jgi:hypothetical protein
LEPAERVDLRCLELEAGVVQQLGEQGRQPFQPVVKRAGVKQRVNVCGRLSLELGVGGQDPLPPSQVALAVQLLAQTRAGIGHQHAAPLHREWSGDHRRRDRAQQLRQPGIVGHGRGGLLEEDSPVADGDPQHRRPGPQVGLLDRPRPLHASRHQAGIDPGSGIFVPASRAPRRKGTGAHRRMMAAR